MSPSTVSPLASVKALTFDVFGTTVDWRTSVVEELTMRAFRKRSSPTITPELKARLETLSDDDWATFAQSWRNSYSVFTRTFNPEVDAWKTIDQHHRDSLVELLRAHNLVGLYSDSELTSLSLVWHRLVPWNDSSAGLAALGKRFTTSTLSNGNVSLLRDLDDFGALGFHHLLSGEIFKAYKPNPVVYAGAIRELGEEPAHVAMVAAHLNDLAAARASGMRTVYVARPREEAWAEDDERFKEAKTWVDLWITEDEVGFETVAQRLEELM